MWSMGVFLTEEELMKQASTFPRDCGRVGLVADSYGKISRENSTRAARGEGSFS